MKVTRTKLERAVFLGLAGRLTVNSEWSGLHAATCEISDPEVRGVFVDLENVTRLDCSGIGELIRIRSRVACSGRAFGLVNLDRYQRSILELLRIPAVCRVYADRHEALRSLARVSSRWFAPPPESSLTVDPHLAIARVAVTGSALRGLSLPSFRVLPRRLDR